MRKILERFLQRTVSVITAIVSLFFGFAARAQLGTGNFVTEPPMPTWGAPRFYDSVWFVFVVYFIFFLILSTIMFFIVEWYLRKVHCTEPTHFFKHCVFIMLAIALPGFLLLLFQLTGVVNLYGILPSGVDLSYRLRTPLIICTIALACFILFLYVKIFPSHGCKKLGYSYIVLMFIISAAMPAALSLRFDAILRLNRYCDQMDSKYLTSYPNIPVTVRNICYPSPWFKRYGGQHFEYLRYRDKNGGSTPL